MPLLSTFGAASTRSFGGIGAAAAGEVLDIDDVFSIDLWTSDGSSTQTINNNIDLSTEGGLVWIKDRSTAKPSVLVDTARISGNTDNYLMTNSTNGQTAHSNEFGNFTSTGYTLPRNTEAGYTNTNTGRDYVGWTWRKAPKWFDCVTWTGDGTNYRNISHNLGTTVGHVIVKKVSGGSAAGWINWHRTFSDYQSVFLNTTEAVYSGGSNGGVFGQTSGFTNTQFQLGGPDNITYHNENNSSYVAYVFAHNDGDGGFGPDSDQDVIKCGSYTGNGSSTGPSINLGFEPQWVLIKLVSSAGENWILMDNMRGMPVGSNDTLFEVNDNGAEKSTSEILNLTATGFDIKSTSNGINTNNQTYIYMAIRRGPLAEPESASDVFALGTRGASTPGFTSNFPVDMFIRRYKTGSGYPDIGSRLTGAKAMQTSENFAEGNDSSSTFDHMNGYYNSSSADSNHFSWMWKRAPGYFDVCCYSGTGSARTISHNLGVVPEMMWVKNRTAGDSWQVYHSALGNQAYLSLNNSGQVSNGEANRWNSTTPTASVFSLGTSGSVNGGSDDYINYLFSTVAGVSKVGSYTGTGSDINIDCGFTSGARFVLIKNVNAAEHWFVFDSVRGITASTSDPFLYLSITNAEGTSTDIDIDPLSSGFKVAGGGAQINGNGNTHIFYAIA